MSFDIANEMKNPCAESQYESSGLTSYPNFGMLNDVDDPKFGYLLTSHTDKPCVSFSEQSADQKGVEYGT
jgi:hypothetical protein